MGVFGKVAIAVALALPMTAYVAGTMVAGEPEPVRHDPIVMEAPAARGDAEDDADATDSTADTEPPPDSSGPGRPAPDRGGEDRTEDPPRGPREPEVITVDPDDIDDDRGDGGDDDSDDDSVDDDSDDDDDDGDDDD